MVTVQQASKNVVAGTPVTFNSTVSGTGALSYQWLRNNAAIAGATSASYSHPAVLPSDSAVAIRVQVKSNEGTTLSRPVALEISGPGVFPFAGANNHASPISPLAGSLPPSGTEGSADGFGQQARFKSIANLAIDNAGVMYATDSLNYTVRRITPDALVSTLAGSPGTSDAADGQGAAAGFRHPVNIAVTGGGTVYVQDEPLNTDVPYPIRSISPAGVVATLRIPVDALNTNANGTQAQEYIESFAVDALDNLYIVTSATLNGRCEPRIAIASCPTFAGYRRYSVRKLAPGGAITTVLTSESAYGFMKATLPDFDFYPNEITVNAGGKLFLALDSMILTMAPGGALTALAGVPSFSGYPDGTGSAARFSHLINIAVDKADNVYVSDVTSGLTACRIRQITPAGVVKTVYGDVNKRETTLGSLQGSLATCTGLAIDSKNTVYTSTRTGIVKIVLQ